MRFRSRLTALVAGMIGLVIVLLAAGWWASGRLLGATDFAYQQGLKLTQTVDLAREAQVAFQRQVQEWKNVLIRGADTALRDRHWKGFEAQEEAMDKGLQTLSANLAAMGMEEAKLNAQKLLAEHKQLGERYRVALNRQPVLDARSQSVIDTEVRGMDRPTSAGIDTLVSDLQKRVAQRFESDARGVRKNVGNQFLTAALVALLLTALLVAVAVALSRSVLNALGADPEEAVAATSRMARGDLTQRLNAKTPASLIGALELMQSRLRNISLAIRGVADDITARANMLSETVGRDALLNDVERLREAISRVRIDRDAEKAS